MESSLIEKTVDFEIDGINYTVNFTVEMSGWEGYESFESFSGKSLDKLKETTYDLDEIQSVYVGEEPIKFTKELEKKIRAEVIEWICDNY